MKLIDTDIKSNGMYAYRVMAFNQFGPSPWSEPAAIIIPESEIQNPTRERPLAPVNVSAVYTNKGHISIAWTQPVRRSDEEITSYNLVRTDSDGKTALLVHTSQSTVAKDHSHLAAGKSYTYTVQGFNRAGPSEPSEPSNSVMVPQAQPPEEDLKPRPPQNPTARAIEEGIQLQWEQRGPKADIFRVERTNPQGKQTHLSMSRNGTQLAYIDSDNVEHEGLYAYRVQASNQHGDSEWSEYANVTITAPGAYDERVPVAPHNPRAQTKEQSVLLRWDLPQDEDPEVDIWEIWRLDENTPFEKIGEEKAPVCNYLDMGDLKKDTEYTYSVRGMNRHGEGDWSDNIYATTTSSAVEQENEENKNPRYTFSDLHIHRAAFLAKIEGYLRYNQVIISTWRPDSIEYGYHEAVCRLKEKSMSYILHLNPMPEAQFFAIAEGIAGHTLIAEAKLREGNILDPDVETIKALRTEGEEKLQKYHGWICAQDPKKPNKHEEKRGEN